MPRRSAGLLPYRSRGDGGLELFLVHPGGPFWAAKDEHAWSVAKGEVDHGEVDTATAAREFEEELGVAAPSGPRLDLGEIRQSGGKVVRVWAIDAPDFEVAEVVSNGFDLEWPPRSGRRQRFAEVDRAEWMPAALAVRRLVRGQSAFVERLAERVGAAGVGDPEQW